IDATITSMTLIIIYFMSSKRRHTIFKCDWSSDVCSSDLCPASAQATERYKWVPSTDLPGCPPPLRWRTTARDCLEPAACRPRSQIGRASCRDRELRRVCDATVE